MPEPAPTFNSTPPPTPLLQPSAPAIPLDTLFDLLAAELALFDASAPYRCVRSNQQFFELLDSYWQQRESLAGVALGELFDRVGRTPIQEVIAQVLTTGEPFRVSLSALRLVSGTERSFYSWSLAPLRDGAGTINGLLLLAQIHPAGRVAPSTPPPPEISDWPASAPQPLLHTVLQASEAHYRTIWAATNDAMVLSDERGIVLEANPAYLELYGYSEAQIIGHSFAIIFPKHQHPWAIAEYQAAFWSASTETSFESAVIRSDGSQRIVESRVTFIEERGRRVAMLSTIHDITTRKAMEQALNESEQRYRMLVNLAPVGIFETDVGGGCTYVNGYWQRLTGLSPTEAMQHGWIKALHPDDLERVLQGSAATLQSGQPFDHEYRFCLANGQVNWVIVQITPIHDVNATITGYLGVMLDVTARRTIEDQARQHNQRYQSVVVALGEGIVIHRQDGTIETANAAATQILGLTLDQLLGRASSDPLWHTVHPDGSAFPGDTHPAMITLRTGQPMRNIPMGVQKHDGSITWISINAQPLYDIKRDVIEGVVASFVDMTDYRNAQAQLQASLAEKEVLLKEVHHRVKNNLQVIISLLRLQALPLTDPAIKELFNDTQNRVHAMALVHEQLYGTHDLAHIGFASYVQQLTTIMLRSYPVPHGQVKLVQDIDAEMVLTIDIAAPLGLILTELLSNSLKYAFPDHSYGVITIHARHSATRLDLVVQDDGIGLPLEHESGEIRSLGLQLVHRLVRQLGGDLVIAGPPGTTFQIAIPLLSKENHP
ncbi:MAG: PAS domain S-box protein [Herpetosiphonaceae bacterium]|nr:PAS domain S-box protein [Herpetosiphonaceae bacterium]